MTLPGFRTFVVEPAQSRVVTFLSTYLVGGLEGHAYPSLYRPDCIDVDATVRAATENADLVKGIKAHAELGGFARWGAEVMRKAARIGETADLPVYVHFGQLWPLPESGANAVDADDILPQIVDLLKPGDILAHPFTRHPGGFVDSDGRVHPIVSEALARGLRIDVGHGHAFDEQVRLQPRGGIVDLFLPHPPLRRPRLGASFTIASLAILVAPRWIKILARSAPLHAPDRARQPRIPQCNR